MAGMPERIGKGPILRALDGRYQEIAKHNTRLQRLKNAPATDDIADIGGKPDADPPVLDKDNVAHIKRHWLKKPDAAGNPSKPYWGNAEYVAEILKQGFIAALTEAANRALPIETLWICSGRADYVSVFVTWNTRQVTLILDTPTLPDYGYAGATNVRENIWAIKRVRTPTADPNNPEPVDQPIFGSADPLKDDIVVVSNADLGSPMDGSMIVKRPIYMQ